MLQILIYRSVSLLQRRRGTIYGGRGACSGGTALCVVDEESKVLTNNRLSPLNIVC